MWRPPRSAVRQGMSAGVATGDTQGPSWAPRGSPKARRRAFGAPLSPTGGGGGAPGGNRRRGGLPGFAFYTPGLRSVDSSSRAKQKAPGAVPRAASGDLKCANAKARAGLSHCLRRFPKTLLYAMLRRMCSYLYMCMYMYSRLACRRWRWRWRHRHRSMAYEGHLRAPRALPMRRARALDR